MLLPLLLLLAGKADGAPRRLQPGPVVVDVQDLMGFGVPNLDCELCESQRRSPPAVPPSDPPSAWAGVERRAMPKQTP